MMAIMKWIEAKVVFDCPEPSFAMDLISNIFYDFSLQGVAIEEPGRSSTDNPQPEAKENVHAVTGYIPMDESAEHRRRILESKLENLNRKHGIHTAVSYSETAEEDWAESWKAFFKPEKIGRHLVVKPTWQAYPSEPGDIILEIDPGMAFGTGTHPTTALCLQMIETYLKPGDTFLDLGTGSGILMVAAAKLGAGKMLGIDIDPAATEIAGKNMRLNDAAPDTFDVSVGRLTENIKDRYQLVVANILTETILVLLDDLGKVLADGGMMILSGITEENARRIVDKMAAKGFTHLETRRREEWVAIAGR